MGKLYKKYESWRKKQYEETDMRSLDELLELGGNCKPGELAIVSEAEMELLVENDAFLPSYSKERFATEYVPTLCLGPYRERTTCLHCNSDIGDAAVDGKFCSIACALGNPLNHPTEEDPVNHPKHYTAHPSGIECIEITRHMSFNLGNAMKYIWRADEKGKSIEDLRKAIWYLTDEIARRRNANDE